MSVYYLCLECGHKQERGASQCPSCNVYGSLVSRTGDGDGDSDAFALSGGIVNGHGSVNGHAYTAHAGGPLAMSRAPRATPPPGLPIAPMIPPAAPLSTSIDRIGRSEVPRLSTHSPEIDRVLGGGLVRASAVLIAGSPGAGKSTLLLRIASDIADNPARVLYASAEETLEQIAMRGDRIGARSPNLRLLAKIDDLDQILAAAAAEMPAILIVDSIQTVRDEALDQPAGSVYQVRNACARLCAFAKASGTIVVLVGHITKDGGIAGPKTIDHLVDVVLFLDDVGGNVRHLAALGKNRFGDTNEVGVLEMTQAGLVATSHDDVSLDATVGVMRFPAVIGGRGVLVEIEALVGDLLPDGRRGDVQVSGVERSRVARVLAILAKHAGLDLSMRDVYVSASGGYRLTDPCADVAIAMAITSSATGEIYPAHECACGELALTGAVRSHIPNDALRRSACGGYDFVIPAWSGSCVGAAALSMANQPGGTMPLDEGTATTAPTQDEAIGTQAIPTNPDEPS
jgi:DNA repair protein RadA/Sms